MLPAPCRERAVLATGTQLRVCASISAPLHSHSLWAAHLHMEHVLACAAASSHVGHDMQGVCFILRRWNPSLFLHLVVSMQPTLSGVCNGIRLVRHRTEQRWPGCGNPRRTSIGRQDICYRWTVGHRGRPAQHHESASDTHSARMISMYTDSLWQPACWVAVKHGSTSAPQDPACVCSVHVLRCTPEADG